MKKIFLSLTLLFSALVSFSQVQDGGVIQARNNAYARGQIGRNLDQLKVWDSAVYNKLVSGIQVTNFPTSFLISNFPAIQSVSQSGTWNVGVTGSVSVTGTFWQTTQPVSGTFWQTTQPVSIASMPSTPVTGTFWQSTQPVSMTALPAFSAIPAFKIDQTTPGTTNRVSIGTDGTVAITGSVAITNANLDAALSTRAKESGGNLDAINTSTGRIPAQGQALAAASMPVVLPAAQITAITPPAAITNYANETGGNLAALNAKFSALGQNTAANSQPVVLASDQIGLSVTGATSQTAIVNNILTGTAGSAATDVSKYRSFAIQINCTATGGTFVFEGSVDNVNFNSISAIVPNANQYSANVGNNTPSAGTFIFVGAIQMPYMRLRISATLAGGSITSVFSYFSTNTFATPNVLVQQGTPGNLNVNVNNVGTVTTLSQFLASAAAAEATSNPTTTGVRGFNMLFNGTTFDRQHGNWNTTTGDAGAKIAAGNGATQTNYDSRGAEITVLLGTTTGTFTTFQTQLQWSPDAGTTWLNYGPAQTNLTTPASGNTFSFLVYPTNTSQAAGTTPANLTTGATQTVAINGSLPRTWRMTWNIAGTSPSTTITAVYVNYQL